MSSCVIEQDKPTWFDVLLFFQSIIPGSDLAFFGVARATESLEIELEVQTQTEWTKARLFKQSGTWYVEYPVLNCTVCRAVEPQHYQFCENALISLIKTART